MKKNDLRKALSQVQPDEELICRTLDKIHRQKQPKTRPVWTPAFQYRLAGALCALIAIIGLSTSAARFSRSATPDPQPTTSQQLIPNIVAVDVYGSRPQALQAVSAQSAAERLRGEAAQLQSGWILVQGSLEDVHLHAPTESGWTCSVTLSVAKVWDMGGNPSREAIQGQNITAELFFEENSEMELFADAVGCQFCVLWVPGQVPQIAGYQLCQ